VGGVANPDSVMQIAPFTRKETAWLAALAVFGFVGLNGVFLYCLVTDPSLLRATLVNPLALTFMLQAFFLMFLLAWLVGRAGLRKPSTSVFIVLSIIGSLAFSVPASLWLAAKNSRQA
jgi:hypothetical protein